MRADQRDAASAFRHPDGGQEYESIALRPGFVELVLDSLGDPLLRGRRLAEQHPGLAPPEPHEPVRRLFDHLDLFDSADDARRVLDVRDRGPDCRSGCVDGYPCFNEHGVPPGVRARVDRPWATPASTGCRRVSRATRNPGSMLGIADERFDG